MASTRLYRTMGTPSSNQKFTISTWVKRAGIGSNTCICGSDAVGSQATQIYFKSDDTLRIFDSNSSTDVITTRKFRDPNAWYHIVVAVDTSLGTASDRVKLYVNGTQETSFGTSNYSGQNNGWIMTSSGSKFYIGVAENTGGAYFGYMNGVMSHFHFVDNQQYNASVFGSTDSTTGEWKINTSPTMTMGNMGFTVLKDGNTYTDQSTNSNDFSLSGTLTKTEDCPSNVFATINPLYTHSATYANGNLKSTNASNKFGGVATIGVSTGKWYAEFKYGSASANYGGVGIFGDPQTASNANQGVGKQSNSYSYRSNGEKMIENSNSSFGNSYDSGNIIGVALDLDNNKLYFSKDGVWQNSGDPTSGSTGTGAIPISLTSDTGSWFITANGNSSSATAIWEHNYGNGYFGTTAVSSAGTNASGIGIFEYDVPTGYTALSTKGLNL